MKTRVVVLSALLGMSMSAAQAGPCTTEIDNLTKTMASKDAGQGPTSGAGTSTLAGTSAGQHPPTEAMSKQTQGVATSSQDVRLQNAGQPTAAQKGAKETPPQPPTAAMNQQTQGQAAPSGGQPPTAAMSEKTQGQMPAPGPAMNTADASAALTRARQADAQGKEADCISAIGEAKRLSGQH
jgi:hypothetical protein